MTISYVLPSRKYDMAEIHLGNKAYQWILNVKKVLKVYNMKVNNEPCLARPGRSNAVQLFITVKMQKLHMPMVFEYH